MFISGYASKPVDNHFFNDSKYLSACLTSPISKCSVLPGLKYYMYFKVLAFNDNHFEMGALNMAYSKRVHLKQEEVYKFCN